MRILIVCKFNQARSIIIGAALRKLLPSVDVRTAGIDAINGMAIPEITAQVCREWKLTNYDALSINVDSLEVGDFDSILAVDEYVFSELRKFNLGSRLQSLRYFTSNGLTFPQDPTDLDHNSFKLEVAKGLLLAQIWARSIFRYLDSDIDSYWFDSGELVSEWMISREAESYSVIVDTNLYVPDREIWSHCNRQILFFNTRELRTTDFALELRKKPLVLVSLFETDSPVDLIFSRRWIRFLEETSKTGRTALVAHKERNLPHMESEFLLGLSHASQVKAIQ